MAEIGVLVVIVLKVNKQNHLVPLEVSTDASTPASATRSKRVTVERSEGNKEQMRGKDNRGVTTQLRKLRSHQSKIGRTLDLGLAGWEKRQHSPSHYDFFVRKTRPVFDVIFAPISSFTPGTRAISARKCLLRSRGVATLETTLPLGLATR